MMMTGPRMQVIQFFNFQLMKFICGHFSVTITVNGILYQIPVGPNCVK